MKTVREARSCHGAKLALLNSEGKPLALERKTIGVSVDWSRKQELEAAIMSATKLTQLQFVLLDDFSANDSLVQSALKRSPNLYHGVYREQVRKLQEVVDLWAISATTKESNYFRDHTVVVDIPILYFCRHGHSSDCFQDRNIYLVAEHFSSQLFLLLIERFFTVDRQTVTTSNKNQMIEEKTLADYADRAVKLQQEGKIEAAIKCYEQALKQEPQQQLWVFDNFAECLIAQSQYQQALEIIKKGVQLYPQAASLYRYLGVAQDRLGNINDVIVNYDRAIALDENQPFWVYCVLADYYQRQGKIEASTRITYQGIQLYPQQADMYRCLGVIQDRQGQVSQTIASYQKAIALEPQQPFWVYCALIERLNSQGLAQEAISVGNQGLQQYPEQPEIYYHLGAAQQQQQDIVGLAHSYSQAIKLNPNQPVHLYLSLIESLLAQDKLEQAIELVSAANKLYPEQADAFRSCYHKILEIRATDLPLYQNLAQLLHNHQELGEAIAVYNKGLLFYPDDPQLQEGLETISPTLLSSNRDAESVGKSISLDLTTIAGWQSQYEQALQLQMQNKLEQAVAAYQQSIIRNPSYAWSYHNLGDIQLKQGKWEDAIASYQRAIELNPDYFWSNYNLGVAYNNSGRWGEAIKLYRRSIELNPSQHLPHRALKDSLLKRWHGMYAQADLLLKQNNRVEASATLRQAIKLFCKASHIPPLGLSQELPQSDPSLVLVVDDYLPQCLRYRVEQKVEQLEYAGVKVEYFPWRDVRLAKNALHFAHAVIFYRVPALPDLIETIEYAKSINKVVFYEIDDLIFNAKEYPDPLDSYGGQVSEEQYRGLMRGTTLFHQAMALCDYGIASTPALAKEMGRVVRHKTCFVHRNALDRHNSEFLELDVPKIERDYISIFYGSGTKAHNADFEKLAAPAIAKILQQYPHVRLTLMGYLVLPKILLPYQDQIDRIELIRDVQVYWEFLRQADINIAMLLTTAVNNCKSELKWFEAGCLGVPSVVSNTTTYVEVLNDGIDALIAATPQDWYVHLRTLVTNPKLRQQIGQAACDRVVSEYSVPVMANNIKQIINSGIKRDADLGKLKPPTTKQKLLIVNVFYPPQSIGGATRIVKDNVDVLKANYGDEYEISIFTTDDGNPHPYEILEYAHEGINVTKISSPMMEGMDWQYENPRMYEIFTQYLEFNQPDLIHFHCIQRLTASVLEAAADCNIPYLVTAHDAWWISDHQFLVNEQGVECDYNQNDPVVTAYDAKDLAKALRRKRYLKERLQAAAGVLAVSEAFTAIYQRNGIVHAQANRNGIILQPRQPRQPNPSGKVRLAHIGGMAAHKGYFLFQDAVKQAKLTNCEVVVVSHAQVAGSVSHDTWGTTPVKFISKVPQTQIYDLYSEVDVLLAPSMWPESFGLVTREAAAAGVWVVASDKGALAEDLVAGVNGDIFNCDYPDELVKILQRIDRDPEAYQQLVAQDIAIRTTQQQITELNTIYQDILRT